MLTKMRKSSALLLSLAVVCATVAFVPQTAGAAASIIPNAGTATDPKLPPVTNNLETFLACPAGSAAAAGFTDTTSTDVDCIKMYGVTTGKTATTYDPSGTISRQDMARYIHRLFVPTGMAAAGATAIPAFTDMPPGADAVAAINALASHGITAGSTLCGGTSPTFCPDDLVTRAQMAAFLDRFARIVKDHAGAALPSVITNGLASGEYNYTDIAGTTWEETESIARLFNLGVTEGACTAVTCSASYRPSDNITRAEMATMLVRLLNHTNARPAGVTIQATEGLATVGAKTTLISVRNADFTPQLNTQVDHFYDPTQLTTARALAANAPFTAVLNTVSASVTSAAGTAGTLDALDPSTDAYGNVAGTGLTTAANSTTTWWAWTGTSGTIYVDGTTAGVAKLEAVMGAADTTAYADHVTYTISGSNALGKAIPLNYSTYSTVLTGNDGISTMAGTSRTLTVTMDKASLTTAGTAHTVPAGYTFKFAHKKVDMLGNVTITNSYVAAVGNTASYTVTCGADNSAATIGAGNAASSYWEAHEVTVSSATAAGTGAGVSWPALGTDPFTVAATFPTDGGDSASLNISCDDNTRAFVPGAGATQTGATLAISTNTVVNSTAGSLVAVSSTAYDQYGDGIAGVTSRFMKSQNGGGAVQQAILTSGSNGVSTLNVVLCSSSFNGTEAFSINTTGATMQAIATSAAGATLSAAGEGLTVYCATAGTDGTAGVHHNGAYAATGAATEIQSIRHMTVAAAGDFVCSYTGIASGNGASQTTAVQAWNVSANDFRDDLNALTNLSGVSVALVAAGSGAGGSAGVNYNVTFAASTGNHNAITCDGTAGTALVTAVPAAVTISVVTTTAGVALQANIFVDDDTVTNTLLTKVTTTEGSGSDGASAATALYRTWTYDSTDTFNLDSTDAEVTTTVAGATEAQFEAANALLTGEAGATPMTINYRTAATTTGVSYIKTGS